MSPCGQDDPHIMQNFIYTMNDPIYRNDIMKYHLSHSHKTQTHRWLGTWVLYEKSGNLIFKETDPLFQKQSFTGKNLSQVLQRSIIDKIKKYPVSMFTVCLVYDEYLVHYVAFIYLQSEKQLISFDPGVDIYHHGQKTIVPIVQKMFLDHGLINKKSDHRLGYCHNIRWKTRGLQFTGVEDVPDAFCQSWTIFFLIRFLYSDGTNSAKQFVHNWCKIRPDRRAVMLTERFIIPSLLYFPKILKNLKQMTSYKDPAMLMHKIISPGQKCLL